MADVAGPIATLAAVLVGGGLTHQVQARSWRRERRADAYGTVITRISDLDREVDRLALDGRRDLDIEAVVHLTEPLRSSVGLARLYAGRTVDGHLLELLRACFQIGGHDHDDAMQEWYATTTALRDAMREDLHGRRIGRNKAQSC